MATNAGNTNLHNRRSGDNDKLIEAPAPWTTRCETYWMLAWLSTPLPADVYNPLEASHPAWSGAEAKGGLAMMQIVRYSDTPVGPFDELLIFPGRFQVTGGSHEGKSMLRASRIYVSQKDTAYNGRKYWNAPKYLARFEFSHPAVKKGTSPPTDLTIAVFPPDGTAANERPFFNVTLTPSAWLPGFPFSKGWLPINMTTVVMPPLTAGPEAFMVGIETWKSCSVDVSTSKARFMSVKQHRVDESAREGFWPDIKPWIVGLWLEDAVLHGSMPEVWKE